MYSHISSAPSSSSSSESRITCLVSLYVCSVFFCPFSNVACAHIALLGFLYCSILKDMCSFKLNLLPYYHNVVVKFSKLILTLLSIIIMVTFKTGYNGSDACLYFWLVSTHSLVVYTWPYPVLNIIY